MTRTLTQAGLRLALFPGTLTLLATLVLPAAQAGAALEQVSNDPSGACESASPSASALSSVVVFESLCDLTGGNADGNREVFRAGSDGVVTQLTDTTGCTNANPVAGSLGQIVSFDSDCDLTGANADGNVEIFQIDGAVTAQLTDSTSCSNGFPSSSLDGATVAFESDCDLTGANADRNSEIFIVSSAGVATQLTDDTSFSFCGSFFPSINAGGSVVAFESDCDLTADNDDQIAEIFSVTSLGVVTRLTFGNDNCDSFLPSISGTGDVVAFESDCDLSGSNGDGSVEVFTVDPALDIVQISDDPGVTQCSSVEPSISSDGASVTFTSFCDPTGGNPDQSFEVFTAQSGQVTQVTDGAGCTSAQSTFAAGGETVVFESDCDLAGTNADGGNEIFRVNDCSCGSPVTEQLPPTASDALFVLMAAVGQAQCSLCECDVNASLTMTASDALIVLQSSVGQQVVLECS